MCLLDGIFGDLGSIWALFWGAFWGTFLEACLNLYVNGDMQENTSIYYGLAMSEPLEN